MDFILWSTLILIIIVFDDNVCSLDKIYTNSVVLVFQATWLVHNLRVIGHYSLQKFGFIKRVDKGWITTVKDLESRRFER